MINLLNEHLAGRYRVESLAGRGGMATVYRAVDLRHDRTVAIKLMNADAFDSVGRDRFLREIRVTAGLTHPHLLALYDSGEIGDLLFYVMPFVEGETVRQVLQREKRVALDDVVKIVREAARGLSYAHARGIVHRDVKPENILLAGYASGDGKRQWNTLVADFGISGLQASTNDHLTATGVAVGSPHYMSPEQATGGRVDSRTDIYALGAVAFELIEGRPPHGVPAVERADIPASARAGIMRALAQDASKRFSDIVDFADALENSVARRPDLRRRVITWLGVAAALILLASTTSRIWRPRAAKPVLTRDSIALVSYNRARANQGTRNAAKVVEAFGDFSRAVERDSGFALAWAGLARTAQLALLRGFTVPGMSNDSLLAVAVNASGRALVLDSSSAEGWLVHARVLETVDPTTRTAVLSDVRHALAIDSTNGEAWFALGRAREELLDSAGARAAYTTGLRFAPAFLDLLAFRALNGLWSHDFVGGMKWADSAIVIDPTYGLARETAALLATELHDWPLAQRQLDAYRRIAQGPDVVSALGHLARLAALRGDPAAARKFARDAERLVDSADFTKHQAAYLGMALAAAGDTAAAVRWLAAFSPRGDVHYQLHLQRDPALAWVHDRRYSWLLTPSGR